MDRRTKFLWFLIAGWMALAPFTWNAKAADRSWTPVSFRKVTSSTGASHLAQVKAIPGDFGFPVPDPEPKLPDGIDAFDPPAYATGAAGPAIAEISKTADRDEIVSMTGVKLDNGTSFDVFAQKAAAQYGSVISVPALRADDVAATILLPGSLPAWSMYLIWPERDGIRGKPLAINRTEGWWLGPDNAVSGTTISIYGRNLSRSNGTSTSFIYIKPVRGAGQYVTPLLVNPFKVDFKIPDLAAGSYEVWIHNGHGGGFGWSGPLTLRVPDRSPWAGQDRHIFNIKDFGAIGNGAANDTPAIEAALAAAQSAAPSTVYFPSGTYLIASALDAPSNVRWMGDGMESQRFS